jgi:hypothetical protein
LSYTVKDNGRSMMFISRNALTYYSTIKHKYLVNINTIIDKEKPYSIDDIKKYQIEREPSDYNFPRDHRGRKLTNNYIDKLKLGIYKIKIYKQSFFILYFCY